MLSVLTLGLIIGMRHSFEADHIAAVASLSVGSQKSRQVIRLGVLWGIGHSVMLLTGGLIFLYFEDFVPKTFANTLEIIVGVMLVLIGADVLRRLIKERVHFHIHGHGQKNHFHAHSHQGDKTHAVSIHNHSHAKSTGIRAFIIGCVHGLAGTSVLVVLTLGAIESFWLGVAYMLVFSLGSIFGMAVMSFAISVPMKKAAHYMTWGYSGLNALIGIATIIVGSYLINSSWI